MAIFEAQTQAARDVLAERERQKSVEGWTPEHDDDHDDHDLALAAACYAAHHHMPHRTKHVLNKSGKFSANAQFRQISLGFPDLWPWSEEWWKPKDRRRDLVRSAALILAEIERIDRLMASEQSNV